MYLHADKQTSATGCFVQMEALEKRSLRLCVAFLEQIAKMTSNVVLELCAEQCNLSEKVKRKLIISCRLIQPKSTSIYSLPRHGVASVDRSWRQGTELKKKGVK